MKTITIKLIDWLAIAGVVFCVAACTKAPDMSVVAAEAAKPISRADLFQAVASNGKVLVASSAAGNLLTSSDGGANWKRTALAKPSSIIGLAHCPDGSFVGVDFYKKAWFGDASGTQWTSSDLKKSVNALTITCDGANKVWIAGSHLSIASSADKGATWTNVELDGDAMLGTIQFVDESFGVATGEFGTVATTTDGGKSWTKTTIAQKDYYPYSAVFTSRQNGVMSGLAGVVLATKDGGKTWAPQANNSGGPIYALARHGDTLYGVGAGGVISSLQGEQWVRMPYDKPAPAFLTAVASVDNKQLAIAGAAGALQLVTPSTDNKNTK
jgi:photosystem II stability/assembly factor-like uncharacterized protein